MANINWPSDGFSRKLGAAAQIAQIVAIVAAGVWAFFVWNKTSQAGTDTGVQVAVETSVSWSETHQACRAAFRVTMENVGQRTVSIGNAKYSVVAVPATRLAERERFQVLTTVKTSETPIEADLNGVLGPMVPKEIRFKEVFFIFRPDRTQQYSVEVIVDEGRPETVITWHAQIESCDPPLPSLK